MIIILSPAKRMRREEVLLPKDTPAFLEKAEVILKTLRQMTPAQRAEIWNCSAKLCRENEERLSVTDLRKGLSPALFSYCGLAYTHLAPEALTDGQLDYLDHHLCILSALYGVLKPMDGIVPYRLEMKAPLSVEGSADLYAFWNQSIARYLESKDRVIVNLASKEYSDAVRPYLSDRAAFIDVDFVVRSKGKLVTKATPAKMARGSMTQWAAVHSVEEPSRLKDFDEGYTFLEEVSDERRYVFVQNENET